jgi:protein KRI1
VESSDEENVEKAEEFEREYNFRFEEDGGAGITGFSRNVESVRRKDDRRKKERESKAARKAEEKARKEEELKRLRNLKKSEILGKLEKIRELSGAKGLPFSEVDLEGDFDPENYDKLMEKAFDEDYYVDDDPEGKPEFREEIDIGPIPVDADEDYYGYAAGEERPEEPEAEEGGAEGKKKRKKKKKKDGQQEEAFIMDADFLDEAEAAPDAKAARLPKKKVQAAVDKYLEDTYQLDFEDVVGFLDDFDSARSTISDNLVLGRRYPNPIQIRAGQT